MIGATGNNGSGGVGVNWDVDIMQVDMGFGGLSEANVIAAYDYPYEMRVLFNESQGARGIRRYVTNASWGIDSNPANYIPFGAGSTTLWARLGFWCGATATNGTTSTPRATCPPDAVHLTWCR